MIKEGFTNRRGRKRNVSILFMNFPPAMRESILKLNSGAPNFGPTWRPDFGAGAGSRHGYAQILKARATRRSASKFENR